MPVLDAKALKSDPEGLAFLRDVLRSTPETGSEKPLTPREALARLRRAKIPASTTPANLPR